MAKILYVEDTENNRVLVKRRLEQKGHQVLTAENAEDGLVLAQVELPDLILMDMGMPGMDGWAATRHFKADAKLKHIPVIAVTAHAMPGDREKTVAAGCDDYKTKPFDFPRLFEAIEYQLARRQRAP